MNAMPLAHLNYHITIINSYTIEPSTPKQLGITSDQPACLTTQGIFASSKERKWISYSKPLTPPCTISTTNAINLRPTQAATTSTPDARTTKV